MKFVHEFVDYPNHKNVDNGWWEYDEITNKCYNVAGGWHFYHLHPKDEFIEGTWDDVLIYDFNLHRDDYITGWISPEGDFFGCSPQEHSRVAEYIYGMTEREMENSGYIKVYELPIWMRNTDRRYDYFGHPTAAQQEVLIKLGIDK